jgi:hypothetical protein
LKARGEWFGMSHRKIRLVSLLAAALAAGCAPAVTARPVVVELFESQGCSSCPPANANLAKVADRPDVIALNFAVTYWDGLGWKDSFAQPPFTARQWDYARAFHRDQVFTPEVVADGRRDGVGADPADFARLVGHGAPAAEGPSVALAPGAVTIGAAVRPSAPAEVWLARYDPRVLQVSIRAGENGGKKLPHKNIVRELVRVGGWSGAAETLRLPPARTAGLVTVVLVQAPKGGPILAAARGA